MGRGRHFFRCTLCPLALTSIHSYRTHILSVIHAAHSLRRAYRWLRRADGRRHSHQTILNRRRREHTHCMVTLHFLPHARPPHHHLPCSSSSQPLFSFQQARQACLLGRLPGRQRGDTQHATGPQYHARATRCFRRRGKWQAGRRADLEIILDISGTRRVASVSLYQISTLRYTAVHSYTRSRRAASVARIDITRPHGMAPVPSPFSLPPCHLWWGRWQGSAAPCQSLDLISRLPLLRSSPPATNS